MSFKLIDEDKSQYIPGSNKDATHTHTLPRTKPISTRRLLSGNSKYKRKRRRFHNKKLTLLKHNIVTNLSNYQLTHHELQILNKGLSYVPTNFKPDYTQLNRDLTRFERTLQLHNFFEDIDYDASTSRTFEQNPTWWPPILNPKITQFTESLKHIIFTYSHSHIRYSNITRNETRALWNLRNNKNIVIKKADKSAGIVIMNKIDYEQKINDMLNDVTTYTLTNINDTAQIKEEADEILINLCSQDFISTKQLRNLVDFTAVCPVFYGIPKVHKTNTPLRPIVSQVDGPTSAISKYVDKLLSTAESRIPYLLQDTTAFLQLIEENKHTYNNSILVTLDVVSLYTNIPQKEGADYVTQFYTETVQYWNQGSLKPIPPDMLHKLILFILQHTTFEFYNRYYTQNYGTTMGSNFSVKFANIYMYMFFRKFYNNYNNVIPPFTARLVDDIFFPWSHTEQELLDFVHTLNRYHTSIKFELNYSFTDINFLDTTVYIDTNKESLHTKLFVKPTHKNQYLHFTSEHPYHMKKSIPYSQALRLKRLTDNCTILTEDLDILKEKFVQREYPINLLNTQIDKIHQVNRLDTLQYNKHKTPVLAMENALPLIITYYNNYSRNPSLHTYILEHWKKFLKEDEHLQQKFDMYTPKIIFKRGTSIQNFLVKSKYNSNITSSITNLDQNNISILQDVQNVIIPGSTKCNRSNCKCCSHMVETNTFQSTCNKQQFPIHSFINCNSRNIIYLITCVKCRYQYIGQTGRQLKDRLNDHRSNILTHKLTAVAIHFSLPLHKLHHLEIIPIEQINTDDLQTRLSRENYWIKTLQTRYPNGLNHYPLNK